eukprot:TRINITY_DN4435_c0_g1_i3.p1 TRINITY_DN4435_c0_g1~~TRINITY_DN4435_c0_g1_i3.p1  ORF type:complete len:155 (+),score=47.10 TRINITY_DN4435_c0_g1_i3:439-903(+)
MAANSPAEAPIAPETRRQQLNTANLIDECALQPLAADAMTIVVIDGTWQQARMMRHQLPSHLPMLRLQTSAFSQFTLRQQTEPGRVCTLEAVAILLQELHQSEAAEILLKNLHVLNDRAHAQTPQKKTWAAPKQTKTASEFEADAKRPKLTDNA